METSLRARLGRVLIGGFYRGRAKAHSRKTGPALPTMGGRQTRCILCDPFRSRKIKKPPLGGSALLIFFRIDEVIAKRLLSPCSQHCEIPERQIS